MKLIYCYSLFFLSSLFLPLHLHAFGAHWYQGQPEATPPSLEINLPTRGNLSVQATNKKNISFRAPLKGKDKKDTVVHLRQTSRGMLLFSQKKKSKATLSKTGKNQSTSEASTLIASTSPEASGIESEEETHDNLSVDLPKDYQLYFTAAHGDVTLQGVSGVVEGNLLAGNILLEGVSGQIQLFSGQGDATLRKCNLSGSIGVKQGNLLLEDVSGELHAFSGTGKVKRRFTQTYFTANKLSGLQLEHTGADIEILEAPKQVKLWLDKGDILISQTKDSLQAVTLEGNISLPNGAGVILAHTNKGNLSLSYKGKLTAVGESIDLMASEGDITLYIPTSASAMLSVELLQKTSQYRIVNEFSATPIEVVEIKNPGTGQTEMYQSTVDQKLSSGVCPIRVRALNGNVYIKKLL